MAEYLIQDTTLAAIADAIRLKTGKSEPIPVADMANEISNISVDGGDVVLRYITFMSYDGTVEYGKKAVVYGDDCADPIAIDLFDTPTRESTVQYDFTFAGWASEPNGGLNSNVLKDVRANKTVYANFISTLRYYTITFYDDDGTTVLGTKSVEYGSIPSYIPTKEGASFNGWVPELAEVTGEASYTAQWTETLVFAYASWDAIARVSQEGTASQHFKIGDTKEITYTAPNGTVVTTPVKIIGFDHDETEDGTKVGITLFTEFAEVNMAVNSSQVTYEGVTGYYAGGWYNSNLRKELNETTFNSLDDSLKSVIKQVKKESSYWTASSTTGEIISYDKLWLMSAGEQGRSASSYGVPGGDGSKYSLVDTIKKNSTGSPMDWWLRSGSSKHSLYVAISNSSGNLRTNNAPASASLAFGFCV